MAPGPPDTARDGDFLREGDFALARGLLQAGLFMSPPCAKHLVENEAGAFSEIGRLALAVTLRQIADRYEEGDRRIDMAISHSADRPGVQKAGEVQEDMRSGWKECRKKIKIKRLGLAQWKFRSRIVVCQNCRTEPLVEFTSPRKPTVLLVFMGKRNEGQG